MVDGPPMRFPPRLLVVLAAVTVLPWTGRTEDYKYPKASPVLSVVVPEEWDAAEQTGPALLLLCTPPDESSYTVSLMTLPAVGDKADLERILGQITRAGAQGAGMTEVAVSKAIEETIGKSPRLFTKVTASGKHNDEPSAFTYYAFRLLSTGKTYAIGVAGAQAMIDAHRKDFEGIVKSLAPLSLTGMQDNLPVVEPSPVRP